MLCGGFDARDRKNDQMPIHNHLSGCRTPVNYAEIHEHVIERQLMRACLPEIIRRLNTVVIDEIGHTFTGHRSRRSLDLKVDMRFARISGDSNLRQNLTAPHVVPHLYTHASWL